MPNPVSVHITFGTYGTRLQGEERPTVHHQRNQVGQPFEDPNPALMRYIHDSMTGDPLTLTHEQRLFVQRNMVDICRRGGWTLHQVACQPDHVHLLATIESDGKVVRKWVKTWLTQQLNEAQGRRTWWAKGGSCRYVSDQRYFEAVERYIRRQKARV